MECSSGYCDIGGKKINKTITSSYDADIAVLSLYA